MHRMTNMGIKLIAGLAISVLLFSVSHTLINAAFAYYQSALPYFKHIDDSVSHAHKTIRFQWDPICGDHVCTPQEKIKLP